MTTFDDLKHNDHRVRLHAVDRARRLLADAPDDLWRTLSPSLCDPFEAVRAQSALVLGDAANDHPQMLTQLAASARDGSAHQRQAALLGLGRAGLSSDSSLSGDLWDDARAAALDAASAEADDVRFQAMTALERLAAHGPDVLAVARERLNDKDPEVGGVAAELLASLGDADSAPALWTRADAVRKKHRRPFLMALASILAEHPDAVTDTDLHDRFLRWMLLEAKTYPTGIRACEVLGRLNDSEAIAPLQALAEGWATNRFLRVAAAAALVRLGSPIGETLLGQFMTARRKDMRGFAIEQIGALALTAFTDSLIAIAADPSDYHSDTAVLALAALGGSEALDAIQRATQDPRPDVREAATGALNDAPQTPEQTP